MRTRLVGPIASPVCLLLIVAAACARQQSAPAIPVPLAAALIDNYGSATPTTPEFAVGKLPPGYPPTLVPSGPVRIVGGMRTDQQVVAVFADSTRRLAAVFEQLFEESGFKRPAPSPGSGFSSGSGPYSFYCRDSATVMAAPLTGADRNTVRVTYRQPRGYSACPMRDRALPSEEQLPIPELRPPPGVHARRSGGGGGGGESHTSAEITGAGLVPSTIVAHYAAQLVAAGWTTPGPANSERLAAQFFETKDASGAPWDGVLMAFGTSTAMDLSLTMHRRPKP
jgi:hypothetical protein